MPSLYTQPPLLLQTQCFVHSSAGLLPLSGLKMYNALGFGWGNSLLAFIALALVPVPVAFVFYGEKIRKYPQIPAHNYRMHQQAMVMQ